MSGTPPDQKEEAGAPDGSRNPYLRFIAWGMLAIVVYVFSLGPAAWLMSRGFLSYEGFALISFPAHFLPGGFSETLIGYVNWWIALGPSTVPIVTPP